MRRGIESFVFSLSNEICKSNKWSIIIYTWYSFAKIDWGKWNSKIIIRKVPSLKYYRKFVASIFYKMWIRFDNPDLIICNFLWHGELSVFRPDKDIAIFHNPVSQLKERYIQTKSVLTNDSNIVFDSIDSLMQYRNFSGFKNSGVKINTGVNINYFTPKRNKILSKPIKLVCISEFEERKGVQFLIKALPDIIEICPVILNIYGSGRCKALYEKLIIDLKLIDNVIINKPVNNTRNILWETDIYFLLSNGEGFPLGLLEALSCGVPAVTSSYPPFNEMDDSVVTKIDRNNPNEIVSIVNKLSIKDYYNEISFRSRDYAVKNFSWESISSQYIKYIEKILESDI